MKKNLYQISYIHTHFQIASQAICLARMLNVLAEVVDAYVLVTVTESVDEDPNSTYTKCNESVNEESPRKSTSSLSTCHVLKK